MKKYKLNIAYRGHNVGDVVNIDEHDPYWARRIKDAKSDKGLELYTAEMEKADKANAEKAKADKAKAEKEAQEKGQQQAPKPAQSGTTDNK